jgi:hypothetical protein
MSFGNYRYRTLFGARLSIVPDSPPADVQARVDQILTQEVGGPRTEEVAAIATRFSKMMVEAQMKRVKEVHFRGLISRILEALDQNGTFSLETETSK